MLAHLSRISLFTSGKRSRGRGAPYNASEYAAPSDGDVDTTIFLISQFLKSHHLEPNPVTLVAALEYTTGHSIELQRLIDAHTAKGRPLTTAWLSEKCFDLLHHPREQMDRVFNAMNCNLDQFQKTTQTARRATREYDAVLSSHADELTQNGPHNDYAGELAHVLCAMAEKARKLETELARSQKQAARLKDNLDSLQRKANIDHLTRLPNQHAFEQFYIKEVKAARLADEGLCLAIVHIDNFKELNENHGYETGDRVLRAVARRLATLSDGHSHIFRLSGATFALIFRDISLKNCANLLDELRDDLASRRLVNRRDQTPIGFITISAGITDIMAQNCPKTAKDAAYQALYMAREQGNRICIIAEAGEHPYTYKG